MNNLEFYTLRPTLAERLFDQGEIGKVRNDPFIPGKKVWYFIATESALLTVAEYYTEINRALPDAYARLLKAIRKENKEQ